MEGMIRSFKGDIFSAEFVKKDGSIRRMVARTGVKKGVVGTGSPNGLNTTAIRVFDMEKGAFRQINLATVRWIKTGGVKFLVTG